MPPTGSRGGGQEDFNNEAAALRAQKEARERMIAGERVYQRELASTTGAEDEAARTAARNAAARKEQAEATRRQSEVAGVESRGVRVDTAAIEANTRAREANARAQRTQQESARAARQIPLAPAGARDPAFPQAFALAEGGNVTQYRIRQQLEGVGSRRATALQAAVAQGFRPADPATQGANQPLTRTRAAEVGLERAEAELTQATRELTNLRRRQSGTDEERLAALEVREAAADRRNAARLELESARADAASAAETRAARQQAAAIWRARSEQAAAIGAGPNFIEQRQQQLRDITGQRAQRYMDQVGQLLRERGAIGAMATLGTPLDVARIQPVRRGTVTPEELMARRQAAAGAVAGATGPAPTGTGFAAQVQRERVALTDAQRASAAYTASLSAEERVQIRLLEGRVDEYMRREAAAASAASRAVQASGAAFSQYDNSMRRHGALTTEFIAAAARGETTIREMGNQALATAGKFGGWTAAGAALYTAADAVRQLGTGAVESQNGVNQLQRVMNDLNADDATEAIIGLSRQFNVPIEVASDAVYRMGQRFHELPDAVQAARAALFSLKTGDVDVPTSADNLIAITRAFNIEASGMKPLFDQINQAQNEFGTRIGETEAGLAKAGGAFHQAGGDVNYLLGLFVAIQAATNRSGQEIGTGLARGVTQIRQARNQRTLRELGVEVDPNNFQRTLQSAMRRANEGVDVNRLASGLLGNQYARLLAPVLANQDILNRALEDTSPQAAQGSADRELARVMQQLSEQAQAVGNNLQRIGAELARSGALIPFAGALRILNLMLTATQSLMGLFNQLPSPIRQAVTVLGEMAIALAAMRRLGATDRFAGGPLGFLANPDRRLQTFATRGLRTGRDELVNQLESQGRREVLAFNEAAVARQQSIAFRPVAEEARTALPSEERTRILAHREALEADAERLERQAMEAQRRTLALRTTALELEQELTRVQELSAAEARRYIIAQGIVVPRSQDVRNLAGTAVITGAGEARRVDQRVPSPTGPVSPLVAAATTGTGSTELDRLVAGGTRTTPVPRLENARQAVVQARDELESFVTRHNVMGRNFVGLGRTYDAVERSAYAVIGATERAVDFTRRAATGVGGLGPRLRAFAASLGPLDLALIGIIGAEFLGNVTDKLSNDLDRTETYLRNYTGETQQARDNIQRAADRARAQSGDMHVGGETVRDALGAFGDAYLHPFRTWGQIFSGEYETPAQRRQRLNQEAIDRAEEADRINSLQARAARRGTPTPLRDVGPIVADIRRVGRERAAGIISQRQFDDEMARLGVEAQTMFAPTAQKIQQANAAFAEAARMAGSVTYAHTLRGLDDKSFQAEIDAVNATIGSFGMTNRTLRELTAGYLDAIRRWGGRGDAASIKNLATVRENTFGAIQQAAQDDLDAALSTAVTERDRRAAYAGVTINTRGLVRRLTNREDTAQANLENAVAARNAARRAARRGPQVAAGPAAPDPLTGVPGWAPPPFQTDQADLDADARAAQDQVDKYKRQRKALRDDLAAARKKLRDIRNQIKRDAAFSDRETGRNIELAYEQSQTTDPGEQAADAVRIASRGVRDAARTYGEGSRQWKQAMTALNLARQQRDQQVIDDTQAENALTMARAGNDPIAQAAAAMEAANNSMSNARNRSDRLNARAQQIQAGFQAQQAQGQLAQARFDLQASATEDPVRQALIARREAADAMTRAQGPIEQATTRAAYNRAVQGYRNARVSQREEDINFDLQMGRISTDTAASLLSSLARTHGLARRTKQQLLLQAKQLRDEASGDDDLNVDNIRLPSLYEVRRFAQEGQRHQVTTVNNSPNVNLYVDGTTNMDALARTLNDVTNLPLESMARATGAR